MKSFFSLIVVFASFSRSTKISVVSAVRSSDCSPMPFIVVFSVIFVFNSHVSAEASYTFANFATNAASSVLSLYLVRRIERHIFSERSKQH